MEMESLVRRCKMNDRDAFDELLSFYENYLYRLCYGFTLNKEETLDILQEIYLKVFRAIRSFDENRPIMPWLKKIAINTSLNYVRDKQKHTHLSLNAPVNEASEEEFLDILESSQDVEKEIVFQDSHDLIMGAMERLPPLYRASLVLRCTEGMSYKQIAAALGQPEGTVKSNVSRARKLLKKSLQERGLLEGVEI